MGRLHGTAGEARGGWFARPGGRRWTLAAAIAAVLCVAIGSTIWRRWARADARRRETPVLAFLKDEPLTNLGLRVPRNGITGALAVCGIVGPHQRRMERVLTSIIKPVPNHSARLSKTAGPAIVACRAHPDGVSAELRLERSLVVGDPAKRFGPYSAHERADFRNLKDIDFYTYGDLDLGIKDGVLKVVRVR